MVQLDVLKEFYYSKSGFFIFTQSDFYFLLFPYLTSYLGALWPKIKRKVYF